ncbi:phosphate ABC transporter substrate-binding protein [Clostridium estertheticum]|uniref:Phosphate-binding protein n=1 Tax=Clostridium estertheticum TaxID=238834 RepID=A0A7Y3SW53_9CLOT|nr:phosphate ABC transporter substrate-binding protein [Clostridium estertheticum]MBW9171143.1 phosphate ABC transporter substrate-binding protein [Clostridium estertheticum]MBX4266271.1 phosphate ABC transporter substrate-binding protein [Clostridium estertheticum]NNU76416.1 phosphate ABC transporter substrate-binding protein [Clostridium estertheticum]WBL45905.1 phosphate ABC transporter substrate-binding protein [Clostridium estertheticum]WLC73994.1 phosphate ABC transporter substrate-bindi
MKKKYLKLMVATLTVAMTAGFLTGCGSKTETTPKTTTKAATEISGSITAAGSTALQPLAELGAKNFKLKNTGATVNVQGGGSGTGLKQVGEGSVEIGNSDIYAKDKAGIDAAALTDTKVCVIGFAAVTNPKVKVESLTKKQLIDIFTGKIKNWKEVGGADIKVTIINRPKSSGTRATFKEFGLDKKEEATGLTQDSSGSVKQAVKQTDGAISYLALSYFADATNKEGLNILKIDGVEATAANISTDKYKIWSYEHMYTKGASTGITKAYLDYMTSSEMHASITKLGYIPMADMKAKRD